MNNISLKTIKKALWTNLTIKICSCIFGFCLWSMLSNSQLHTVSLQIPVCFFGTNKIVSAPETVYVTLRSQRSVLTMLDTSSLAVHINTDFLKKGKNTLLISEQQLFLPSNVNLLYCNPRIAEIMVETTKEL